jgi:uncharacterized protein YlxP (DUF503 family)
VCGAARGDGRCRRARLTPAIAARAPNPRTSADFRATSVARTTTVERMTGAARPTRAGGSQQAPDGANTATRYRRTAVSPAYVALLLIHLHFPEAGSLKAKRKELASVKAQLHTRLGVAVSEVDGQDTWQRSTLAGALTSGSFKQLQRTTDHVEGWLLSRFPDGVRVERSLTSFEDAGGIG